MTTPTSRFAYNDAYEVFDKALEDPAGIRIRFPDYGAATHFRMRLHQARQIDRADNAKVYEKSHPMHGRSTYDSLVCRVRGDTQGLFWVYIEPTLSADNLEIESLSAEMGNEP